MAYDLQGYILSLVLLVSTTILVLAILTKTRTKVSSRLPPSPPWALPIIGHLHLLSPIAHQSFQKLSNRYGPLIRLSIGYVPCVLVSSAEIAKECLKTQETSFLGRPDLASMKHVSYPSAGFTFEPYGPYWKLVKKISMSKLLGGQTLDQLLPIRHEELKKFLNLILLEKANKKEAINVRGELAKLTNSVISKMTMGQKCSEDDEEAEEIRKLVKETTELAGRFNLSDCIWFLKDLDVQGFARMGKKIHDKFDAMLEKIINEHEESRKEEKGRGEKANDLVLDFMLEDLEDDENQEIRLTRDHVKAFIQEMIIAGTETVAKTIEWALSALINHPNVMKKAREEIYSVVGKTRLVEESDIANLPYLQAIVKETLRLHPTGPLIVRESNENCTVNGYFIPQNTRLYINIWAINRDPKYWESPLEFKPERFLNNQLDVRGQHFHFMPFGSGRRSCPGTSYAVQLVEISLAAMIQCFEWKTHGKVDMEEAPGLSLTRANPLICVPESRLSPIPI